MLKRSFAIIILFSIILCAVACGEEHVESLTYAVFPYMSDIGYYQEIIENRWAELEPDIRLERAEWDCYSDGIPEGIDVIRAVW